MSDLTREQVEAWIECYKHGNHNSCPSCSLSVSNGIGQHSCGGDNPYFIVRQLLATMDALDEERKVSAGLRDLCKRLSMLSDLRAVCDAATPGPWDTATARYADGQEAVDVIPPDWPESGPDIAERLSRPDATFIAAARTAMPLLLDVVEALEKLRFVEPFDYHHYPRMGETVYMAYQDAQRAADAALARLEEEK